MTPVSSTAERIEQHVMFVEKADKRPLLGEVLKRPAIDRALVFTRTKHGANRVVEQLGQIARPGRAIHGNKTQNARQRALEASRTARSGAGRHRHRRPRHRHRRHHARHQLRSAERAGNLRAPHRPHGAGGASGIAISFCDSEERAYLKDIEKLIKVPSRS